MYDQIKVNVSPFLSRRSHSLMAEASALPQLHVRVFVVNIPHALLTMDAIPKIVIIEKVCHELVAVAGLEPATSWV